MKIINQKILRTYFHCPYKCKQLYFSSDHAAKELSENYYLSYSSSIYKTITDFYKEIPDNRTLNFLYNKLRENWIRDYYLSQEQERSFGLKALALLENFYNYFYTRKVYNYISYRLNYILDDNNLVSYIQLGEYYKHIKKFVITEFSVGSNFNYRKLYNDFDLINKIILVKNNFDVNTIVYIKNNINYLFSIKKEFKKDDINKFTHYMKKQIYKLQTENKFEKNITLLCRFCDIKTMCRLDNTYKFNNYPRFISLLNFIENLMKLPLTYNSVETFLKENFVDILDINGYISVINKVNLQDWFNPEITDYLKLQNLKFKFFEINDNENYYISELPNKRIMLIKHPVKLDRFYITKAELLLNYVKIKLNEVKLYNKSVTDKLTGLYNHGYMNIIIPEEIKRVKKFNQLIGFILFDIDFFKKFNDTYGHQTGDEVLKFISKIFKENIRNCDIPIRYGGEEFLCVCPDIDKKHLYYIADNLRQIIANSVLKYDNKKLSVNISGGISIYPEESYDYMELINIADKRLYKSKENGRNQITYE